MCRGALLLAYFACIGHTFRVQKKEASHVVAAFTPSGPGAASHASLHTAAAIYPRNEARLVNMQTESVLKRTPLADLKVGGTVEGKIREVYHYGAFLDIGASSDALLHVSEILNEVVKDARKKFTVGETLTCSIQAVDLKKKWIRLERRTPFDELLAGTEVEGDITKVMPYGAYVDIGAISESLLPVAEISNDFVEDATEKLRAGERIKARIKKVDYEAKQLWLTCREKLERDKVPLEQLRVGDEAEGIVRNVMEYAASVDIGAETEGVLPNYEISNEFVKNARDAVRVGQKVKCRIKTVDLEKQRFLLTCRDPASIEGKTPIQELKVGTEVEGMILSVTSYGAFVDIGASSEAFLHAPDFSDVWVDDLRQELTAGANVKARIKAVDLEQGKVWITCKALADKKLKDLKVGNEVEGRVQRVFHYGAWVDIGADAKALLPVGEIQDGFSTDAREELTAGQDITCRIKSLNLEKQHCTLTCRSFLIKIGRTPLEELKEGSEIQGKILKTKPDVGAWVDIGADAYALIPISEISPEFVENARERLLAGKASTFTIKRVNLDTREVLLAWKEAPAVIPLDKLVVGAEVQGKVLDVKNDFAFLDIGASVDAMLTATQITGWVTDLADVLHVDETITCRIHYLDAKERQIRLSYTVPTSHKIPLKELEVGAAVEGAITRIMPYGAFVDIGAQKSALMHISDTWLGFVKNMSESFAVGETVHGTIKSLDLKQQKMNIIGVGSKTRPEKEKTQVKDLDAPGKREPRKKEASKKKAAKDEASKKKGTKDKKAEEARIAAEKAEQERQAEEARIAAEKAEQERQAEEIRLAAEELQRKAEEARLATEKAEEERKKEEARIAAEQAEEERKREKARIAEKSAEEIRSAAEELQRRADEARLATEKAEIQRIIAEEKARDRALAAQSDVFVKTSLEKDYNITGISLSGVLQEIGPKYTFITCDSIKAQYGQDVFCPSALLKTIGLQTGSQVDFDLVLNSRGEPQAFNVRPTPPPVAAATSASSSTFSGAITEDSEETALERAERELEEAEAAIKAAEEEISLAEGRLDEEQGLAGRQAWPPNVPGGFGQRAREEVTQDRPFPPIPPMEEDNFMFGQGLGAVPNPTRPGDRWQRYKQAAARPIFVSQPRPREVEPEQEEPPAADKEEESPGVRGLLTQVMYAEKKRIDGGTAESVTEIIDELPGAPADVGDEPPLFPRPPKPLEVMNLQREQEKKQRPLEAKAPLKEPKLKTEDKPTGDAAAKLEMQRLLADSRQDGESAKAQAMQKKAADPVTTDEMQRIVAEEKARDGKLIVEEKAEEKTSLTKDEMLMTEEQRINELLAKAIEDSSSAGKQEEN